MELIGIVEKEQYPIKLEKLSDHHYRVTIQDRCYDVDALELSTNLYSLIHGTSSYEVRFHSKPKKDQLDVEFHDETIPLTITDPMSLLLESAAGGGRKGGATLEAAMPGKVQRILVKEGDEVTEDQGLLVLVAMKMENELGSPSTGIVKQILVEEGANVEGGTPLIIIE